MVTFTCNRTVSTDNCINFYKNKLNFQSFFLCLGLILVPRQMKAGKMLKLFCGPQSYTHLDPNIVSGPCCVQWRVHKSTRVCALKEHTCTFSLLLCVFFKCSEVYESFAPQPHSLDKTQRTRLNNKIARNNTDNNTAKIMNKLARPLLSYCWPTASLKYRSFQHIYLIY